MVRVCCSVVQCDAVCCSVLQCVAASCRCGVLLQRPSTARQAHGAVCCSGLQRVVVGCSVLQRVVSCCIVLQHVAVVVCYCTIFQLHGKHTVWFGAVCCSCSVVQCILRLQWVDAACCNCAASTQCVCGAL